LCSAHYCLAHLHVMRHAGNINELPVVADVPKLLRARTPVEILVINITAAGTSNVLQSPAGPTSQFATGKQHTAIFRETMLTQAAVMQGRPPASRPW
jgi:hypothetical protein